MAITWTAEAETINPATGLRKIRATRTDSGTGETSTVTLKRSISTPQEKLDALDDLYAMYTESVTATEPSAIEIEIMANLQAREV